MRYLDFPHQVRDPDDSTSLIDKLRKFSHATQDDVRRHLPPCTGASVVSFPHCCPAMTFNVPGDIKDTVQTLTQLGPTRLSQNWEGRHAGVIADPAGQKAKVDRNRLCREHGQCLCKGEGWWLWRACQSCVAAMKSTFVSGSQACAYLMEGRVVTVWRCRKPGVEETVRYALAALHYLKPWRTTWVELERSGQDLLKVAKRICDGFAEPKLFTHVDFVATLDTHSTWEVSYLLLSSSQAPAVHMTRVVVEPCDALAVTSTFWRGRAAEAQQLRVGRHPGVNLAELVREGEEVPANTFDDNMVDAGTEPPDSDEIGSVKTSGSSSSSSSSSRSSGSSSSSESGDSENDGEEDDDNNAQRRRSHCPEWLGRGFLSLE